MGILIPGGVTLLPSDCRQVGLAFPFGGTGVGKRSLAVIAGAMAVKQHRTRILISDGHTTVEHAYVVRRGDDLYFGLRSSKEKTSYHASGVGHSADLESGEKLERWKGPPVGEITEAIVIHESGSVIDAPRFNWPERHPHFSGKRSDAICLVDLRDLPERWTIRMRLGLVHPDHLGSYGAVFDHDPTKIVTLVTSDVPWLFVEVGWARGDERRTNLADVLASEPFDWREGDDG